MKNYLLIGILLVVLMIIIYLYYRIKRGLEAFSQAAFGTKSISQGLQQQADLLAETPKSVPGMTKVYLPQIQRDFPEFNWPEFRTKAEHQLRSMLNALEQGHPGAGESAPPGGRRSAWEGVSEQLRRQILLMIEQHRLSGETVAYKNVVIHRTEITRYLKRSGTCVIALQSAVEYYYYKCDVKGRLLEGSKERKEQARYDYELVYVQDASKASEDVTAIGVTCPNCGAPVTNLGDKFCEFCGGAVTVLSLRVWSFNKIIKH